ncbi:TetR/AcrR family transcriptional regulator C-terminal ligand-binding domain-containing protein [uncultured Bifidobacterium sp.]|uniref:TetR/AcrR family transcriptional regulator n=1 Tax=uncultured Bifidobacterium sp. TaxID=165187 RepID=UPI00260E266F|nr:TetR/AcrR family transcriptional regulator C-terminal ligand-binding domain-containing protein [uncultured Bifidobacterium sp.]
MMGTRSQRSEDVDRRLADAVLRLAAAGTRPVSIQSVSDTSGVAKTTIYRRYRNSSELVDGMSTMMSELIPLSLDLEPSRDNLTVLLSRFAHSLDRHIDIRLLGLIIASDNPLVTQLKSSLVSPTRRAAEAFVRRGVDTGVFRSDTDVTAVMDNILGSLIVGASRGEDPSPWADREARILWRALAASNADSR